MGAPERAPPVPKVGKVSKLKRSIEKYSGSYGHPLFGNLTIWFNENKREIMAKTGQIGLAKLTPTDVESILDVELIGPLDFVEKTPYFLNISTPLTFRMEIDGKYQEVENWSMEPGDPVVYKRGLLWEN